MDFGLTEYAERLDKIKERIEPSTTKEATDEEYLLGVIYDLTHSPHLGRGLFSEETAVERLLMEEIVFIGGDLKLRVLCNDLFYWASADGEDIIWSDVRVLWAAFEKGGPRAIMGWCCLKRNLRPQTLIVKRWREAGFWDGGA